MLWKFWLCWFLHLRFSNNSGIFLTTKTEMMSIFHNFLIGVQLTLGPFFINLNPDRRDELLFAKHAFTIIFALEINRSVTYGSQFLCRFIFCTVWIHFFCFLLFNAWHTGPILPCWTMHMVIAKWGQIYFGYFHLIIEVFFNKKCDEFYAG